MIVEILGIPGSGKTFVAENLVSKYSTRYALVRGVRGGKKFENYEATRGVILWIMKKCMQLASFFLAPLMFLLFFNFFLSICNCYIYI